MPLWLILGFLSLLLLFGCQDAQTDTAPRPDAPPARAEPPSPRIDYLELQVRPGGIKSDGRPGDEGVGVKLFLWRNDTPLAARLERGTVEFLLFEGNLFPDQVAAAKPARLWRYNASELERHAGETTFGIGYALALLWGDDPPKQGVVTITARLLDPDNPTNNLYAKPVLFTPSAK